MLKANDLTLDELRDVLDKPPTDKMSCPICGGQKFDVAVVEKAATGLLSVDAAYAIEGMLVTPSPDGGRAGGPLMVPVTCNNCGFILTFNSEILARRASE
ncbi:MAG: hypothetical protein CMO04_16220 [Thalassospira sp.]|nr:hypothetical protein [Thalassospira sp.]|tara:strand:+ start:4269 stop:4568 length:300 start_codon:yes stop_codon:yes gene_type:complete